MLKLERGPIPSWRRIRCITGALLVATKFTQAHLSGADFNDSVLIQAHLDGCVAGPGASKRAVSFEGAHLEGVKFT